MLPLQVLVDPNGRHEDTPIMDLEDWTMNPRASGAQTFECLLDVFRRKEWQGQEVILNAWPAERRSCDPSLIDFWNHRDKLCCLDGRVLKGHKILIPKSPRS